MWISMLIILAGMAVIPVAFADENHKGSESEKVEVEIKAAFGIGYVLRIEADREMKDDNPKPRHSIKSTEICQVNCVGRYADHNSCCDYKWVDGITLSLGEYVFLKLRKGRKIGMDAAAGKRFDFEITKPGKIKCLGTTGDPYCKYK